MNDEIKKMYEDLFTHFSKSRWKNDTLTAFKLQIGDKYRKGPMFVGQAPNGWLPFIPSKDIKSVIESPMLPDGNTKFSDWLKKGGNDHYKISISNFWADSERIFNSLCNGGDFTTDIAYSNLCKIARNGDDPNPTYAQRREQFIFIREILFAEISALKPEYIVFMSGGLTEWFFEDWPKDGVVVKLYNDSVIKSSGFIAGSPFVAIHHPQRKSNEQREKVVNAVIEHFKTNKTIGLTIKH